MNVFISGPALTSAKNMLSVWDWGGGRTLFFVCFCFEDFKLRIKNETQDIAINHNLWNYLFFLLWGNWFYFFQLKENGLWHLIFFLSYTWQSVGFLFHVIHYGCFFFCFCFAHVSLSSHWMTAHQRSWTLTPYVCVCGHRQDTLTCLCRKEATVSSQARSPWVLPCCCHHKITTTFTQQKHAHNQHFSPLNGSVLVTNVTFLVLNHLPLLPSLFFHDIYVFSVC